MSARFAVESWSPEFGSPVEPQGGPEEPAARVDLDVEIPGASWEPVCSTIPPATSVCFIDGVRRIDARVWVFDGEAGADLGICASYAAGVVRCDGPQIQIEAVAVERSAFAPAGLGEVATRYGTYSPVAVVSTTASDLINALQSRMGDLETSVAARARPAELVVVDGPLGRRESVPGAVGYIKSHRAEYLPPEQARVIAHLGPGERTPVFLTETTWSRYSWYLRLPGGSGHPWAGVVRCEAASSLSVEESVRVANLASATLTRFASEPHKDPRAPQNLYPVGGLERELRRRLGDERLMYRALVDAAHRAIMTAD